MLCAASFGSWQTTARADDNQLTPEEVQAGWKLLFDGADLTHWKTNNGVPLADGLVPDGAVDAHGAGGELLVYDREFGDFVLSCDVKMSQPYCNAGVFVRVSDLADAVMTGLEVQVCSERGATRHDFGAIYDLVAPAKNASRGGGVWEHVEIRCQGPHLAVVVDGEQVAEINCDEFDEPGKRPDGSQHKFGRAIKDFAHKGYIGFQDHGNDVCTRISSCWSCDLGDAAIGGANELPRYCAGENVPGCELCNRQYRGAATQGKRNRIGMRTHIARTFAVATT